MRVKVVNNVIQQFLGEISWDTLDCPIIEAILVRCPEGPITAQSKSEDKECGTMRIAVPTVNGKLCAHFGHCDQFVLVDIDPESATVSGVTSLAPPEHEPGVLPRWLKEQGAQRVIAGGMGQRAQDLFKENGIDVMVGASDGEPEQIVRAHLTGTLSVGQNVCDH